MITDGNTLFLRLAGPMQSWGTSSRFQLRRTDKYPSKSGVLGMLLCAMGVRREDSAEALLKLTQLSVGVRVDRCGAPDWDYHTAGAKIGIRSAKGKIKITEITGHYETLLSRRQYLYDASFLVALQGPEQIISKCAAALNNPAWPLFLGRKCCIPTEPVFAGQDNCSGLSDALSSIPWRPRIPAIDGDGQGSTRTLKVHLEHSPGQGLPDGAQLVYDVPRVYGFFNYGARWVVTKEVTVSVGEVIQKQKRATPRRDTYSEHFRKVARPSRLKLDNDLCVFCKSPAEDVHHVTYENCGHETDDDLRSLCKLCHDACTMLEYGRGMGMQRVDPCDPVQRGMILDQIKRLLKERRLGHRRELMEAARTINVPDSSSGEGN